MTTWNHAHTSATLTVYITRLSVSLTTGNTNASTSLTDYRTQLPASLTTGNTNTSASLTDYITHKHPSITILHIFQKRIPNEQSIFNRLTPRAGVSDVRITIKNV